VGILDFIRLMILTLSTVTVPVADRLTHETVDAARSNGLDPILLASLVRHESDWDAHAYNAKVGAYGLTQLHPAYFPGRRTSWSQLYTGATVLREFWDRCGGPWRAVAAYRLGLPDGRCPKAGPQTVKVMRTYATWTARWKRLRR
jgi:soluble lytic murein transglycosylase-like protein